MTHYYQAYNYKEKLKIETVSKVWGSEEIIFNKSHCVKKMTLKPKYQVSMHWHSCKEETFILISGKLIIETINTKTGKIDVTMLTDTLESFTLGTNVPHTFYCPTNQHTDTVFIEASTTDSKDDSYRIFPSGPTK